MKSSKAFLAVAGLGVLLPASTLEECVRARCKGEQRCRDAEMSHECQQHRQRAREPETVRQHTADEGEGCVLSRSQRKKMKLPLACRAAHRF